jgi:MFS family permease
LRAVQPSSLPLQRRTFRRARLRQTDFIVLSLYWVAIGYLWQSLGTLILPDLVAELVGNSTKGTALSVLEGIGTVMAVVWQPTIGAVSDRTRSRWGRRRPFIFAGTAGDLLFLLGIALSGSYWLVVIFYFLLQTASNTAQGPYQGLLPDVVPEDQRGAASGYYGLANLVGLLGGTVGAGLIHAHYGRGAAILSIAVLLVATMAATVTLVPDRGRSNEQQFTGAFDATRATFTTPLRYPAFVWLMSSRLLLLMGIIGIQSFTFFYFSDAYFHSNRHETITATYTLLFLVILVAILVTWPAARLSDLIGRRPIILAGGLVGAVGTLLLVFSGYQVLPAQLVEPVAGVLKLPPRPVQAMLVGLSLGVGFGAFLSVDWAFITDVIPVEQAGLFMGFSNIATAGAGIIARFIGGFLLDAFNAGPKILNLPGGYPVIFTLFFVWMVVGSFLVLKVRPRARGEAVAA